MKPVQTTLEQSPRKNQDKRMQTAFHIYNNFTEGNYLIHKTTRAGCTTALVAESINRGEKFLCVVPTNKIADKTVVADSKKYSDFADAEVIHIPANHECLINKLLCEECPDLKQLPILPLAGSCSKCAQFDECPVTEVLRKPDAKGVVVTYKKLAAMMLASACRPNTMAGQVLEILAQTRNIILDEVHDIQFGDVTSFTVYDDKVFNRSELKRYDLVKTGFTYLNRVLIQFAFLLSDPKIQASIHEVLGGAQDEDYWKHHLNKSLQNPSPGIVDGENETKVIVGAYNEIIELTKERQKYKLEMNDVLELYKMMSIVMSKVISIHATREDGSIKINLSAVDQNSIKMNQSYVMSMQGENRRIFLTSATICSYDYGKMFMGGVKPKKVSFGIGGDPMNSNSKMLILADSKKYHVIGDRSLYNKMDEITEKIITILEAWGDEDCLIVALSIPEAKRLYKALNEAGHPHEVSYYKAPEMMGVSSKSRIMIAVGLANKPSNSFDVITTNTEESKRMLYESVHCDTWQAWSRVKDPSGKVTSIVFALGCTVEECDALTTWGYDRTVDVEPYVERQKKTITISCDEGKITKPFIKKCQNFTEMLKAATQHKQSKNFPEKSQNLLIFYNNISRFSKKMGKSLGSSNELVKLVLNRQDAYAFQNADGTYFKVKNMVTDKVIEDHIKGDVTIGAYQFNLENKVKWICFDIDSHAPKNIVETKEDVENRDKVAENSKDRMFNFLRSVKIPFLLEYSGSLHSYHFWIFLEPVDGKIARQFALDIKREVDIDCEVFPKQDRIGKDGFGNLVKVPFATHRKNGLKSSILVNGELTRDIENLQIEILDIEKYPIPEPVKNPAKTPIKRYEPKTKGIMQGTARPCMRDALTQQLVGTQGHFMRMAIAREYYEIGFSPVQIAKLFKSQKDYDYEFSLKQVNSLVSKKGKRFRCDRLRADASNFVCCAGCEYLDRW